MKIGSEDGQAARPGRENKPHIGIFGRCNSGKSTLLNFIAGGDFALVSDRPGTTTDPVRKSYEILNFAPVVWIDTAGIDDVTELGADRMRRTSEVLSQIDLALLVFREWGEPERALAERMEREGLPFLPIYNRFAGTDAPDTGFSYLSVDASDGSASEREALLEAVKHTLPEHTHVIPSMFDGMAGRGDVVMLVCPIDSEAPAGRLILPQVQAIRNLLDQHAVAVIVQPEQIAGAWASGLRPKLVVTDSQAFSEVRSSVPEGVEITSFSILLARLKGDYRSYAEGLKRVGSLRENDRVLILENCVHQTSCEDIGRVKIPRLLEKRTGKSLRFTVVSGLSPLPGDLGSYSLAVQCGGCMVTRSQLQNRIRALLRAGVPVTNYGMLLKELLPAPPEEGRRTK